ncbi:uncharacterized protein SAPINGB_P004038 [Magnusiomyces paraingens]|uniref:Actin-related protein 5 n=1 Tax=Magnusiomyces paraingens TaxID=2606893 RepID=A0A5E8BSG5_9ASCO|nr:uncharacterized protein SAPINGB_P004038 [Saprochaete ingens]VVT54363.1 unnamed protein product [Saprochaete ingens]
MPEPDPHLVKEETKDTGVPPTHIYSFRDPSSDDSPVEASTDGVWESGLPILIDMGTYQTRAGYATQEGPASIFPTIYSKYRDRKVNRSYSLIGQNAYYDTNSRSGMRSPFDGAFVSNWDGVELILDYTFSRLGVKSEGRVDNPVVMTEMLGCPAAQRKNFNELFFEAYNVQSLTYGIDSLFSYHYNGGSNGVVISSAHESTHVIPVLKGKGMLPLAKRINWGGRQSATYMQNLLNLKYPYFPTKITQPQAMCLVRDYCYVSKNYAQELADFLKYDGLENRERVVQAPFTENVAPEKTAEELRQIEERRKESGRRLQEQAAKMRLEKLVEKENNLEYYRQLQTRVDEAPKKDTKKILDREGFKDQAALTRVMNDLQRAIRKARKEDVGEDDTPAEPPSFPLLDIPDDQLDAEQIKEKRKQRLLKANYDARMRAKEEKQRELERQAEEELKNAEWRERDLDGWIAHHREERGKLVDSIKEKQRLKAQLQDRKSLASQNRMKNIAALMSDSGRSKRRRGGGAQDDDADDNFGADDNDWAVYQDLGNDSSGEEEEGKQKEIKRLEALLLEHDPNFTAEDTREAELDWRKSVVHLFLHGPRAFDPDSIEQQHRVVLNVERIRVPEVLFQPSIAGVDQASVTEIVDDLLLRRLDSETREREASTLVLQDIFLTGGQAHFKNFDERLQTDLQCVLPTGAPLKVRRARDPMLDAWRGMALFATTADRSKVFFTREQYLEMGPHYVFEHGFGNEFF